MNEFKMIPAISHFKKSGKLWVVLALLGAGVILLILGKSDMFKAAKADEDNCVHEEKLDIDDYERRLEEDMEGFCKGILGVDTATSSVRLAGSSQSVYAQNTQNGTGSYRDEYVIIGSGSGAHLIYLGEEAPEILGIGIIISGRGIGASKNEIEALISAAYGVPLNRIYVKIISTQ